MIKSFAPIPETYYYLMDDGSECKRAKGTKKCVIKKIKSKNYKDCLLNYKIISESQQRFKRKVHNLYTEQINKITLHSNDDKRLQTFDKITTYSYGANAFKICESEMPSEYKWLILRIILMKVKQYII